ncbi:MAG: hypothetical protein M3Z01_04960 [Thermoproteota archaeon]|nr:hypothetical protein [Thermoproteota archaeon]
MLKENLALSILLMITVVSLISSNITNHIPNKALAQFPPPTSSIKTYNFTRAWGSNGTDNGQFGQYNSPNGIAIDSSGNLYVSDYDNNRIQKFDSNGTFITKWGSEGSKDGQFLNPQGIATDSSGNVYVSDYDNNRIQKFDSNGTFITKWGSEGSDDGQFEGPKGIAIDSLVKVYVTDEGNNRVEVFIPVIQTIPNT